MSVDEPVGLAEAARQLGKHPATLRRWVAAGAPCVSPGEPGRGRGAMVVVAHIERWRSTGGAPGVLADEWLSRVAEALLAFHREGAHRLVGLKDAAAAAYLHDLYATVARRVASTHVPDQVALLAAIAEQG